MNHRLLISAFAGWSLMAQSGAACAVYQELSLAAATYADVVVVGQLTAYREVGPDAVLTLRVSEVLHGSTQDIVDIGWAAIMAPGPGQFWEIGDALIVAARSGKPNLMGDVSDDPTPVDYWVIQPPCVDAYVVAADGATLAEVRLILDLP